MPHDRRSEETVTSQSARPLRQRLGAAKRRLRKGSAPDVDLQRQVRDLRARVAELDREVIENRQLARRIAELTDVVEQLLLSDGQRAGLEAERRSHARPSSEPRPSDGGS